MPLLPRRTRVPCVLSALALLGSGCTSCLDGAAAAGALSGVVCHARSGRPTAGLRIEVTGAQEANTTSAASGAFRFPALPPGRCTVVVSSGDGTMTPRSFAGVLVQEGAETTFRDPDCAGAAPAAARGNLRGHVCDARAGAWVAGALVTVTVPGAPMQTTTDADGRFTVGGVPIGNRTVRIASADYDRTFSVVVQAEHDTWVVAADACAPAAAGTGGVDGIACADDGSPAVGAAVYADAGGVRFVDVVDNAGGFHLNGLPPGAVDIHVLTAFADRVMQVNITAGVVQQVVAPWCGAGCTGDACGPADGGVPSNADAGVAGGDGGVCVTHKGTACVCGGGEVRPCYSGPEGSAGVGTCAVGSAPCVDGEWGQCVGEVLPQFEVCDGADNNCNNQVDEGLACAVCTAGEWQACYTGPEGTRGVGRCHDGQQMCNGGGWGLCLGQRFPTAEICNGEDDNCETHVDENLACECQAGDTQVCSDVPAELLGHGVCHAGVRTCSNTGQWSGCAGQVGPSTEVCDDADNDCDDQVDEGCPECSGDALVYANTSSELYTVDALSFAVHRRGPFRWPPDGYSHQMTDIAVTRGGQIWGITFDALYRVSRYSVECTLVTPLQGGHQFNALSFLPGGVTERLVAATTSGAFFEIDPATGASTQLGSYGGGAGSAGDLVSIEGAGTFATVDASGEHLARLDDATGAAALVGLTGQLNTWGLGYWSGRLFGFLEEGAVVTINPATGTSVLVASTPDQHWWGAGVTTCAPTQ